MGPTMSNKFIPLERNRPFVISVQEWLTADHLARCRDRGGYECHRLGSSLPWGWLGALSTEDDAGAVILWLCYQHLLQLGLERAT